MSVAPVQSSAFAAQAASPQAATTKAAATPAGTTTATGSNVTNLSSTFLQLLTQELQNQDPTAPMDSTQMVGQMISLNQLEQLASINQTLTKSTGAAAGTSTGAGTASAASASAAAAQAALHAASMGNSLNGTSTLLQGAGVSGL